MLNKLLLEKELSGIDVDSKDRLTAHKLILGRKQVLKDVFCEFHHAIMFLDKKYFSGVQGTRIELGAGVCPLKESYETVMSTDVVPSLDLDFVLDAQDMDVPANSVRAIYGQNCFHHFPDPDRFFSEVERVLSPGGGLILLEPYYGTFASFLYKRLFKTEGFDKEYTSWVTPVSGPMNGANQALSYIVFVRDREEFEKKYPALKIVHQEVCRNYLKYLLSGGLNFRQLVPNRMIPLVNLLQVLLSPFNRWLALHHIVVIRKQSI